MFGRLTKLPDKIIGISFYLLFFLVPLILTPFNYELFEYNKMMLTYGLTVIIIGSWLIKIVLTKGKAEDTNSKKFGIEDLPDQRTKYLKYNRKFFFHTPLDIPILLFLASQIISTFFSIDRHVSIWGYYSRFNGGLFSTISYILLYYAFVSNFSKEKIKKLLTVILTSGLLVAVYGILEHFGIDRDIWVQDVQTRVFSTLGQPNWLAAFLAVLIPIAIVKRSDLLTAQIGYWILASLFYLTLIFTKSRSGFIGLWTSLIVLWSIFLILYLLYLHNKSQSQKSAHIQAIASICIQQIKLIGIYILSFIIISFFLGVPFAELNRFTIPELLNSSPRPATSDQRPIGSSIIDVGITESSKIRNIVWKGAMDIAKHYPFFGTGVETFAFAYYQFRPVEHNNTSEWDFLYNKAHNEYLNYAATTGFFGLGSYLLIILVFIWWNVSKFKIQNSKVIITIQKSKSDNNNLQPTTYNLQLCLFSSWLSILITNFFGFSVVIIQLFFFLIPAISFVMLNSFQNPVGIPDQVRNDNNQPSIFQKVISLFLIFVTCYLLFVISKMWRADTFFALGHNASGNQEYSKAYKNIRDAILINDNEPLYFDEFSLPASQLAAALWEAKDTTSSAQLTREAILASAQAIDTSPNNVSYWKTRTRVYYALSQIDEKYMKEARQSLEKARDLSPTDPKVLYNLAVIIDKEGEHEKALQLLEQTVKLKPDYRDAYFAMGLFYERDKKKNEAKKLYEFILNRINPNDEEAKKNLEELK